LRCAAITYAGIILSCAHKIAIPTVSTTTPATTALTINAVLDAVASATGATGYLDVLKFDRPTTL
jgi:hypothetical protein